MKALAEKLAIEQQIQADIDRLRAEALHAETDLNKAKQSHCVSVDQMRFISQFKKRLRVVLAKRGNDLEAAQKEVAVKQQALIEASRAKKTLEILKEKEEKRYLEKIATLERKNLDEIAGNQFVHQQRNL